MTTSTTPTRRRLMRRRVTRSPAEDTAVDRAHAEELLQSIAKMDTEMRERMTTRAYLLDKLREKLTGPLRGQEIMAAGYRAAMVDTMSRASTEIDSRELYEFMSKLRRSEDFWGAVKPQIGEVKKVLTDREYAKLPKTETAVKKTGSTIVAEPIKTPKAKK